MAELSESLPRAAQIERLVAAALDGMMPLSQQSTAAEMVCASLTLSLRFLQTTIDAFPETREKLREAIGPLYLACADPTPQ